MNFLEQLSEDIKTAMKARESLKLDALRGIKKELLEAKTPKEPVMRLLKPKLCGFSRKW